MIQINIRFDKYKNCNSGALAGNRTKKAIQLDLDTDRQRKERDERIIRRNNRKAEQERSYTSNSTTQRMSDSDNEKTTTNDDYSVLMERFNRLMKHNEKLTGEVTQLRMLLADQRGDAASKAQVVNVVHEGPAGEMTNEDPLCTHTEKTLLAKRIGQLLDFEPMTCKMEQDVGDWLELFEDRCDRLSLSDVQKYSIVQDLLKGGAKLWFDTHKSIILNWTSFKEKIIAHFELVMGIDSFNRYKLLYNRRRAPNESAVDYVHNMVKLCRKADHHMTESTRIKHLLEGLNLKEKSYVEIRNPNTTERFMQVLIECDRVTFEEGKRPKPWMRHQTTEQSSTNAAGTTTETNKTVAATESMNQDRHESIRQSDRRNNVCWTCGAADHYRHACPKNC